MKAKSTILNKEERNVIILASRPQGGQHLNNTEIAQRLGITVGKVKILIHQACIKLGARNRIEAKVFAVRQGEIKLDEIYSTDELSEILGKLHPDVLRRIIKVIRRELKYVHTPRKEDRIIHTDRRQGTILTKYEQDILILVGRGLSNKEIAETLYLSINTVEKFLTRACTKLGVHNRADASFLATKYGEISLSDMFSFNELLEFLFPLETDSIDKMSKVLEQKLRQEPLTTSS